MSVVFLLFLEKKYLIQGDTNLWPYDAKSGKALSFIIFGYELYDIFSQVCENKTGESVLSD